MLSRNTARTLRSCEVLVQDFIRQRTFAGTGHTGNTGHNAKWNIYINIFRLFSLAPLIVMYPVGFLRSDGTGIFFLPLK